MNDVHPLVSIVIACLDAEATLGTTLASCLAQSWPTLEVVVVDNGSSDGSVAVAASVAAMAPWPVHLLHCRDRGANRARLVGFRAVRGEFVNWLDADDELEPDKIERQVGALLADPGSDIAYGDWVWREHASRLLGAADLAGMPEAHGALAYGDRRWQLSAYAPDTPETRLRLGQYDDFLLRLLEDKWLPPHAYLLRRHALERLLEAGALPSDRRVAQDREFFTTAALLGMRFRYVPGSEVVYHSRSEQQITRRTTAETRAHELAAIHARLRAVAARPDAARLSGRHRLLLEQPWDSVAVPAGVQRPEREAPGRFRVRNRGGAAVRVGSEEAHVLEVLLSLRAGGTVEQLAKRIQHREPALWERHADVVASLLRLRQRGLLEPVKSLASVVTPTASAADPRVVVATDVPFWQQGRGDAARIRALVRFLNRHARLAVFALNRHGSQPPALTRAAISVEGEPVRAWLAHARDPQTARAMLARAIAEESAEGCILEYLRLAQLRPAVPAGVLALLDTHDLISERTASFRAHGAQPPADIEREAELEAFAAFDGVILIQEEEFRIVAGRLGEDRCLLAPHPVELPRVPVRPVARHVTFVGSEYAPNVDGLRWFLDQVWQGPDLGDAQLHVYGRVTERISLGAARNVVGHGLVENLDAAYRDTDVVINPVRFGAGLKIKTVEALASGLPLVTTTEGARGLARHAGRAFLVADDPERFRSHLEGLLTSPERRRTLSDVAWRVARELFTPDACFRPLLEWVTRGCAAG